MNGNKYNSMFGQGGGFRFPSGALPGGAVALSLNDGAGGSKVSGFSAGHQTKASASGPVMICVPRKAKKNKRKRGDREEVEGETGNGTSAPPQQLYCRVAKRKRIEDAFSSGLNISANDSNSNAGSSNTTSNNNNVSMLCTLVDSVPAAAMKSVGRVGVAMVDGSINLIDKLRTVRGVVDDSGEKSSGVISFDLALWNAFHFGRMDDMMRLAECDPSSCASYSRIKADGVTALMAACRHGHEAAVQRLLDWGADATFKDKYGNDAALHLQMGRAAGLHERFESIASLLAQAQASSAKANKDDENDDPKEEEDIEDVVYDLYCIQGMKPRGNDTTSSTGAAIPTVELRQRDMPTRLERLLEEQKEMTLAERIACLSDAGLFGEGLDSFGDPYYSSHDEDDSNDEDYYRNDYPDEDEEGYGEVQCGYAYNHFGGGSRHRGRSRSSSGNDEYNYHAYDPDQQRRDDDEDYY